MGLKTAIVRVPVWGKRDDGKEFVITEMPAARAEKWALRMFLALKGNAAGDIAPEYAAMGTVGVFIVGLNTFLHATPQFEALEPLLDEMMECITIVRDPRHPEVSTKLLETDIEEIETRAWLRAEVLSLHVGFSVADAFWRFLGSLSTTMASLTQNPSTSQP